MSDTGPDSSWTVDTLREYLQRRLDDEHNLTRQRIDDLRSLLQERYETQTKALDAAFVAAEKAVQTALASAEKAVTKAETAAERRFESVNEFRQQLADQAATFMPRAEAEARMGINAEKIDSLSSRIDKTEGHSNGLNAGWAIIGSVLLVISAVVTTYIAVHH